MIERRRRSASAGLAAALLTAALPVPRGLDVLPAAALAQSAGGTGAERSPATPAGEDGGPFHVAAGLADAAAAAALERALERADRLEALSSLLVSWRGELVVERYRNGMGPDRPANVKSVSKTLLHPLVGAAIRDGHLEGVHQRVAELLPEYFDDETDPRKREITLGHLLGMSAGLESISFRNYGEWVSSRNWARDALERPLECAPGECWKYSTGNTHLLSVILTRVTGKSTLAYAREVLFEPLGIVARAWDRDPQGNYLGGNNMSLTPRELLRFGELYLNFGRWREEQLVPPEWILASWQPRARSPWNRHGYGYLWWIEEWGGERVYFGWGYGGQYVIVVPSLGLVIACTSDTSLRRRGAIRELRRFFDDWLVPAFAGAETPGAASP